MRYADAVTFKPLATGQIQILRTGTGFWRWDHGAAFAIDKALLARILKNTQLRSRPLRMDFMHWANGDQGEGLGDLMKAGDVDPKTIVMTPWKDPQTGAKEFGLFCPVVWTTLGADAAYRGLDEISPVIEWEYQLPFSVVDASGAVIPAGTMLGPTITGLSLVDQGFFWMNKVRTYSAHGARQRASLYQEYSAMILAPDQLSAFIDWATGEGWDEALINAMIAAATSEAAPEPTPEAAPEMAADNPAAASAVMAARKALTAACTTGNQQKIIAAQKVLAATVAKTKKPATNNHPLAQLLAAANKARSQAMITAAPGASKAGAAYADLEAQLVAQKTITDQLMMKELEREGLLTGIDDPMELYSAAPDYFMKKVQGNVSLLGANSPAPGARSPLREVSGGDDGEGERTHRAVTAYRAEQVKAGRKNITYQAALAEWEALHPPQKKKVL